MEYNDNMGVDEQITAEECIAAIIFDRGVHVIGGEEMEVVCEEDCQELSKLILVKVLQQFRPDLFN